MVNESTKVSGRAGRRAGGGGGGGGGGGARLGVRGRDECEADLKRGSQAREWELKSQASSQVNAIHSVKSDRFN